MKALTLAGAAIERELLSGTDYSMSRDSDEALARVALLAAAPALADSVSTALELAARADWDAGDGDGKVIEIYLSQIAPVVTRAIEEAASGRR